MADCYSECVHWWNRYLNFNQLSEGEKECCAALERREIQAVADNAKKYYGPDVALVAQQEADRQKAQADSDVESVNKLQCPIPINGKCYDSLTDVFAAYAKYAAIAIGVLVGLYVLILLAPLLTSRR